MTVNTVEIRKTYNGNGVTDAFATPYFLADADLAVYVGGVLQTITTEYTISGAGVPAGGTVTFVTPPPTGTANVIVIRDPALTQLTDWVENDANGAEVKETAFDKLTMIAQRQQDKIDRTLRLQDFDLDVDMKLPLKSTRVNKFLAFNGDGEPVASAFGSMADGQVFSNKAAAVAYIDVNGITNGQAYFITSSDGGDFVGVTGASAGTYADNSTSYCGTQFIPTGGDGSSALVRPPFESINVKWFGAVGDGVANDTTAIQSVFDALDTRGGGTVYLPTGNYVIQSYISIPDDTTIYGDGDGSIFRIPSGEIAGLQGKDWSTVAARTGIVINNIRVKYAAPLTLAQGDLQSGAYKGHAIRFRNSTHVIVDRVFIDNAPLSGVDFSGCANVSVTNSYGVTAGQGVVTATSTVGIVVSDNIFRPKDYVNNNTTSIYSTKRTGVDVGESSTDVTITGNVIYDAYYGIYLRDDVERLTCTGNTIKNTTDGIAAVIETGTYPLSYSIISNNVINVASRTGIDVWSTRNCVISGNTVTSASNNGIRALSGNADLLISGNTISLCGYNGISNTNTSNVRIAILNNTCYRNGSGGTYAGIYSTGDARIISNVCHDDSSSQLQTYGIWHNSANTPTVDGNVCFQNLTTQINIAAGNARGINQEGYDIKSVGATLVEVGSAWDSRHLLMGTYHLWVDASGVFRIKSGAPTSDTDGTVVGTQT